MNIISITTRCATVEAFIDLFHRYIDPEDQALFIAAHEPRDVGTKAPFQIRLRDGTIVMRGDAEVVRRWPGDGLDSPWARPGYCIKLSQLETEAMELYGELIASSRRVAPAARRMVPPVQASSASKPIEAEADPDGEAPAAEPGDDDQAAEAGKKRTEGSFPLELGDLIASAPPPVAEKPDDTLWGGLPPPPPPAPRFVEILRSSRRAQIVTGAVAGAIIGTLLAVLTHGREGKAVFVVPYAEAPPVPMSPVPVTPPAPTAAPDVPNPAAAAPPADPPPVEPASTDEKKPRKPSRAEVTLDLRSDPPGAIFYVDGKNVGKAPVKVKVKPGKVKVSARLKGYAEWKDRVRVRDDKKVTARLAK